MAEPFAKFRTWPNVLEPDIDVCPLLGEAPWPQPVNKYAHPVRAAGLFIDPLDFNSQGRPSSPPSFIPIAYEQETRLRAIVGFRLQGRPGKIAGPAQPELHLCGQST